jgi:hypothetical protein
VHYFTTRVYVKPKAGRHPQREPPKCDRNKLSTSTKLVITKLTHIIKEEINRPRLISKHSYTDERLILKKLLMQ